jgi:hypothetical protein
LTFDATIGDIRVPEELLLVRLDLSTHRQRVVCEEGIVLLDLRLGQSLDGCGDHLGELELLLLSHFYY